MTPAANPTVKATATASQAQVLTRRVRSPGASHRSAFGAILRPMVSSPSFVSAILKPPEVGSGRSDTPVVGGVQVGDVAPRRIRMRTLISLRAAYIVGQLAILLVAWLLATGPYPLPTCLGLVGASTVMNLVLALSPAANREARPWEVTAQIAFDTGQAGLLLWLVGPVASPFALLLVVPVTVAGASLPPRSAAAVCALAILAALVLTWAAAPSWTPGHAAPDVDSLGQSAALVAALAFACGFASWSSAGIAQRELALNVTESVLAREQRLSALGALAAAVAHELGTPLATITIIATELARKVPDGPQRDDAVLLVEQARRCRDILRRLAETPDRRDTLHERMSLLQVVRETVEPYGAGGEVKVEALVTGAPGVASPDIWRRPEILHALSTIVENAFDFAGSEVLLTARFDASVVTIEVRDDGPGFAAAILPKLGEPYVTSRPGGEGSRSGHAGMGLGLFIAKTLLERSGAQVLFANGPVRGAIVTARWPRARLEVGREKT